MGRQCYLNVVIKTDLGKRKKSENSNWTSKTVGIIFQNKMVPFIFILFWTGRILKLQS